MFTVVILARDVNTKTIYFTCHTAKMSTGKYPGKVELSEAPNEKQALPEKTSANASASECVHL